MFFKVAFAVVLAIALTYALPIPGDLSVGDTNIFEGKLPLLEYSIGHPENITIAAGGLGFMGWHRLYLSIF